VPLSSNYRPLIEAVESCIRVVQANRGMVRHPHSGTSHTIQFPMTLGSRFAKPCGLAGATPDSDTVKELPELLLVHPV
jgi:hypothetical protein